MTALREPDVLRDRQVKTSVMPEAAKPRSGRRLSYRLLCLAVMLFAALIGFHFGVPRTTVASSDNVAVRYVSGGDQHALFDNESLAGWLPPAAGGAWHLEFDDEHTRVLCGSGSRGECFRSRKIFG